MESAVRVGLTVEQCWHPVPGGSGAYVLELVRALGLLEGLDLAGIAARHGGGPAVGESPALALSSSRLPRAALYEAWNRVRRPRAERLVGAVDVVHATTWAIPGTVLPLVVTVHDLAFLRAPEHFTERGNSYFRRALRIVGDEAAAVIVPSWATRSDCIESGLPADRIHVVPHGVVVPSVRPEEVSDWRQRYGVARPYVLWCGTLEPRKNLPRLIEAYGIAVREHGLELDLVLAGPDGWGGVAASLGSAIAELPPGAVHRVGRLSDADLQRAYAGATTFAFPSLWEGFGMPVLEAMAHGVPVVTSRGTSMAEFVGGGGVVVQPTDPDAIATALVDTVGPARESMVLGARSAAAGASWDASARAHLGVYRQVAGRS